MRRQKPQKTVSASAKRAEASDSKAARKAAWTAGVCVACRHFASIHGPRGCAARFCDCKSIVGVVSKPGATTNLKGA